MEWVLWGSPWRAGLSCGAASRRSRLAPDGLQSLTPSRLGRCALRLPPGDGLRHPPPRVAWRPLVLPDRAGSLTGWRGFGPVMRVGLVPASWGKSVSARGFAWREGGKRRVSRGRPAEIPAPGRCPFWPWPPGPGQSRALRAWCPTPGDGGSSAQRPARETRPRAAPVTACAGWALCRGPCEVRCAGQPCRVHRLLSAPMGSAWRAGVVMSVRPAVPFARAVVSGLRPG